MSNQSASRSCWFGTIGEHDRMVDLCVLFILAVSDLISIPIFFLSTY